MDDIDRIEKINAMTEELKKFGFLDDSRDAVQGAKSLLMSNEEQTESKIFTSEGQVVVELSNSFKRFKDMTTARMHEMTRTITSLQDQLMDITGTLSSLQPRREPLRADPSPSFEAPRQEEPRPQEISKPEPIEPVKQEVQERSEEKPYYEKQGHFTSADVQIEDIFYYGNKK